MTDDRPGTTPDDLVDAMFRGDIEAVPSMCDALLDLAIAEATWNEGQESDHG